MAARSGPPRLREIAERLGVSETAVSFAVNGRPGISVATRKRILESIEESGWTPNYAARALFEARSSTVGFVVARTAEAVGSESFFLQLMTGLQSVLGTSGYGLLFQVAASIEEELAVYRGWRAQQRVDGVVLVDLRADDPRPAELARLGLPAVLAGGPDPLGLVPSVSIDDAGAIDVVVDHLRARGHRRIGYVTGDPGMLHVGRRVEAFRRRAGEQDGVTEAVVSTDFSTGAAARATRRLWQEAEPPTAVIYENEVIAVAGVGELRALGLSIPQDVAVVCLEDSLIGTAMRPQLTALHRDTGQFGQDVARSLLEVLDDGAAPDSQERTPELVVRASTDADAGVGALSTDL